VSAYFPDRRHFQILKKQKTNGGLEWGGVGWGQAFFCIVGPVFFRASQAEQTQAEKYNTQIERWHK